MRKQTVEIRRQRIGLPGSIVVLTGLVVAAFLFDSNRTLQAQSYRSAKQSESSRQNKESGSGDNRAQESETNRSDRSAEPRSEAETLDWLSRDRYSKRQQATLNMWRDRQQSRELVQEAARNPDPEVAGRANWILRQWRRGALPDTPPEIAKLLLSSNGPAAIERLLEAGQFTAALVAIEESAGTVDREGIQSRIASAMMRRFPVYVHYAVSGESLAELLKLIDLVADTKELAVCRLQLMQVMGIEVGEQNLLPSSAALWAERERHRAQVLLWMLLGDEEQAGKVASDSKDSELLHQFRKAAGRWSEIAAESAPLARKAVEGTYEHARLWSMTLIAADRDGDAALREEAVTALSKRSAVEGDESAIAAELRWKCLASHAELEAAIEIVSRTSPEAASALCLSASQMDRAFEVLGYPLDRIDTELGTWIDEAIQSQRSVDQGELQPEISRLLALMQTLISVGRNDAAWTIARRLCQSEAEVGERLELRDYVFFNLNSTRRTDWIVPLAVRDDEKLLTTQSHAIAGTLPDCDRLTFEIVLESLSSQMRGLPLSERVLAAAQLFNGEIPENFDRVSGFQQLFDFVTSPRPTQRVGGTTLGRRGILASLEIVLLFSRHGEMELASQCLDRLIATDDAKAVLFLAERELEGGRSEVAEDLFRRVFEIVKGQTRLTRRIGGTDDVALAVKAKIGLWIIASRQGKELVCEELAREIRLALCSPSTRMRSSVAEYLGDQQETQWAMDTFESVMMMSLFGNSQQSLFEVARVYSPLARETNAENAARWFDLSFAAAVETVDFQPRAYVTLPLLVERWALEIAIERGDAARSEHHLEKILSLDPLDIDFAERLLPMMREHSMEDLADRMLNRIIDRGMIYAREFPFDAMSNNNLAWVAAMNHMRLDDALELAERAVRVEPDSAIYRDTLAEVLFQLGRTREALQVEQGCVLDDPSQWHLHEQIEKYQRALTESESE